MRPVVISSVLLLLSTGAWTAVLATAPHDYAGSSVVLMAVSLWVATVAALAGMLVVRSRWARRTGLGVTAAHALVAIACPVDVLWVVAATASVVAAISLAGPWLNGIVRSLPNASGPPNRAVLVPLLLMTVPFAVGVVAGEGIAAVIVGAASLVGAFWFIRTLPFALVVVRVIMPLIAVVCAWWLGWRAGVVAVALTGAAAWLAWHKSVTRAVIPLVERGTLVAIPPELAPRDVLDAARLDDRGRPL